MKLASIGCGNMGGALLQRWLDQQGLARTDVQVCVADEIAAAGVRERYGVACGTELMQAIQGADAVLLAVKPQQRHEVLPQLAQSAVGGSGPLWISILAGVDLAQLQEALGVEARLVRWMPNTAVAVGRGVVAWSAGDRLTPGDRQLQGELLAPLGLTLELAEAQMDAFTAVAGCGPAYVFALCEALQTAGEAVGLTPAVAADLARQTLIGAARQLEGDARSPTQLRQAVTSKGGMTEAALQALAQRQWPEAMTYAVQAAVQRADALAGR